MTLAISEAFDPEEPVIDAIRRGDRHAFGELVRRQRRFVRGVLFGVLGHSDRVEDVEQQVWATCWQRIGRLKDTRRWRPWLYRLARNAALDAGREVTRRRNHARNLAERIIEDEQLRAVHEAIQSLPALYREPFVLRHVNNWSCKQIAEVMGMPIDTVETRLVRARRLLRESLAQKVERP